MSRCFPFPPPGYEKKPTTEDIDLLKKEKRKEKKHKKDKKDKEKEKKEDRKHKEKKDKHREKKKDKEKGSDEKLKSQNGDILHENKKKSSVVQFQNGEQQLRKKEESYKENQSFSSSVQSRVQSEDKFVQELGRRIRDEEKGRSSLQFPVETRKVSEIQINHKSTFGQMVMIDGSIAPFDKYKEKENDDKRKHKDRDKQRHKDEEKVKLQSVGMLINKNDTRSPNDLKKRKDMETNGFSHEKEPRPNKMVRPTSSILTENGKKQDFPGKQVDRKVNGIIPPVSSCNHTIPDHVLTQPISSKPPSMFHNHNHIPLPNSLIKPSSNQKPVSSKKKPPHPDTKYLKQILTVPKMDHWSGLDDQDWLLSSRNEYHTHLQDENNNDLEVWSKAKQLESVNICALPYVIPY